MDSGTLFECRFTAEVGHAASAMEPAQVNEIVKQLLPKYEATLKTPDLGAPFQEFCDQPTRRPIASWEATYRRVKAEVIELGIPLDPG